MNPVENSYNRLGASKAPEYISWGKENRSTLIRVPSSKNSKRLELRSPDPLCNPYLAFTLLIYAGLYGINNKLYLPPVADFDLFKADESVTKDFQTLPDKLSQAKQLALKSEFVKQHLPQRLIDIYCK